MHRDIRRLHLSYICWKQPGDLTIKHPGEVNVNWSMLLGFIKVTMPLVGYYCDNYIDYFRVRQIVQYWLGSHCVINLLEKEQRLFYGLQRIL